MPRLAHAPAWVAASLLLIALVVYGSLAPQSQTDAPANFDKFQHASVYALLAVWFTGLVARRNFWKVALGLACLGVAMEFLQRAMQLGRQGDPWDVVANVAGICAGVALGAWLTGEWALKVEAWLRRN